MNDDAQGNPTLDLTGDAGPITLHDVGTCTTGSAQTLQDAVARPPAAHGLSDSGQVALVAHLQTLRAERSRRDTLTFRPIEHGTGRTP